MTDLDQLAAEYVLGVLEGEDLMMARGRIAREPEFADAVAQWESQLAPMLDDVGAIEPSPQLWDKIQAELHAQPDSGATVIELATLRQKLRNWQVAGTASAMAAVAALAMVVLAPGQPGAPNVTPTEAPLVASIPIADTPLRLGVTYLPDRSEMLVSASGLSADGVHDHELWLVPPEGELLSLGVVIPGEERRVALSQDITNSIANGSELLLTREPLGGKPAGVDAGPVVASGAFSTT
ncbi:MAG: anti-sigma factor [Erythrobacter sp.]